MTDTQNRRAGGRAARKAARAAPLSEAMRPVRPACKAALISH
jgi:trimethylamine--corrinoid protein Co-methyltransferase